ncbi:hypothetical protein BRADI_4g16511v3 [Brachypodium distachyon]|uniref:Uncharacterized protein n=1 Tax=Brachypodium distachyon TaxID=15368 RepID=A0A2K2CN78_BRADI|nr:hypothetical protein BRADI_4g16511v3 [Brachypodium distachyon]
MRATLIQRSTTHIDMPFTCTKKLHPFAKNDIPGSTPTKLCFISSVLKSQIPTIILLTSANTPSDPKFLSWST